MTTFPLLVELIRRLGPETDARAQDTVGRLTARLWSLRRMSLAIALALDPGADNSDSGTPHAGVDLGTEAALVKDMGTFFEREIIDAARLLVELEPTAASLDHFERYLAETIVCAPLSTVRGGTTQVLRTLIARRLLGALTERSSK
jgi:alkylation response protein AidB-like acyl-CoA dehydrogenase